MGEDENIALVNVKEANSGCGAPVSELYRQMSRQSPKVDIFLDLILKTFRYYVETLIPQHMVHSPHINC